LETIGQGSEATVYRCEDQSARQYAIKIFYFSRFSHDELPRRVKNFSKEARILKYLSQRSRHFVHIIDYEFKPEESTGYMIMELADGSLRQQLLGMPLNDEVRRSYWKQIVTILRELQDAHVGNCIVKNIFSFINSFYFYFKVHADIKPDNIVLVNDVLKVTDLGLAFWMTSPRMAVRRPGIRGTLGTYSYLLYFQWYLYYMMLSFFKTIWHLKYLLIKQALNRMYGQQVLFCMKWLMVVLLILILWIAIEKWLLLHQENLYHFLH